ncbi:MAG: hydroxymethylbilane synthase [Verrucomicrobia bacterium]|nr:hydroxymethylbilane synthase [Verrucomicrobiota bacterium]
MKGSLPALRLGTRGSALALAQTELTRLALVGSANPPDLEIREIKTTGDKRQDLNLTHLTASGHGHVATRTGENLGVGLFTKELEAALLAGDIDIAVHSLKDLPTTLADGLKLAAVLPRADTADVLIYKSASVAADARDFGVLPRGATVATSSLRRQRQLLWHRPDLRAVEVRGNVGTRLAKLAANADWSALILARAGLERLGYGAALRARFLERETGERFLVEILDPEVMLPAVGQGAIGLQCRVDDDRALAALAAVNHAPTWAAVTAERALLALLGGGCQLPLGVATEVNLTKRSMQLRALLFAASDATPRAAAAEGALDAPDAVAQRIAEQLER